jgi:hypothetical protein
VSQVTPAGQGPTLAGGDYEIHENLDNQSLNLQGFSGEFILVIHCIYAFSSPGPRLGRIYFRGWGTFHFLGFQVFCDTVDA